jgi:hypothetical protein
MVFPAAHANRSDGIRGLIGASWTNALLVAYLLFIHERIFEFAFHAPAPRVTKQSFFHEAPHPAFGWTLLALVLLELAAIYGKTRHAPFRKEATPGFVLLWIGHVVVILMATMVGLAAVGQGNGSAVGITLYFLVTIKEFFVLGIILTAPSTLSPSPTKALASDLFLAVFHALLYSVVIGGILLSDNYENYILAHSQVPGGMLFQGFLYTILFVMLYFPLRLTSFFRGYDTKAQQALARLSLLAVVVSGVLPFLAGETSLDNALEKPAHVRILFLNSRKLKEVHPGIHRLTRLEALHLGHNQLAGLPAEIEALTRLRWLYLGGNSLKELPAELANMKSLRVLNLRNNGIRALPEDLTGFLHLDLIELGANPLPDSEIERARAQLGAARIRT